LDGGKKIMESLVNKSLFAISSELKEIFNQLEESGGELTPELEQALQITKQELADKTLNYVHYIKKLESDLELTKVYEEQIKAFKSRKEKTIERLKEALLNAVEQFGEIETDIFKITTRKSEAVEVLDEDRIPMHYFNPKVSIKKGGEVPGALLKQKKNLSIK
jgi:esterase/lipase